jgi:hypothetical protein
VHSRLGTEKKGKEKGKGVEKEKGSRLCLTLVHFTKVDKDKGS